MPADADTPAGQHREMKLVRYANWRINRPAVNAEDTWLITRCREGMAPLCLRRRADCPQRVCLRSFARIRALVPGPVGLRPAAGVEPAG